MSKQRRIDADATTSHRHRFDVDMTLFSGCVPVGSIQIFKPKSRDYAMHELKLHVTPDKSYGYIETV